MLSFAVTMLLKFLTGLFTGWVAEKERTVANEQVGELKQAKATEDEASALIVQVHAARNAVVDLTADGVRNIKPGSDPDFSD